MEEFEGMKRKQLQALCKKHGIPANKSNLEMARLLAATLNKPDEDSSEDSRKLKRVRFSSENDIREYEPSCYKQMARRRSLRGRQVVIEEQCGARGGEGVGVPNMGGEVSLCEVLESEPIPKPLKTNSRRKDDLSKAQDFGDVGKAETVEGWIRTTRMRANREAKASQVAETEIVVLEDDSRLSNLSRNPSRPKSRRDLVGNARLKPTQQVVSRRVTRSRAETEIFVLEVDSRLSNLSRNPSSPKSRRDLGENACLEPTQQVVSKRVARSRAETEIVVLKDDSRLNNLSRNPSRPQSRRDLGGNIRLEPTQQAVNRRVTRFRAKVAGDDSVLQKGEAGSEELDVRKETKKRLRSSDVEVVTETDASREEIEKGSRPVGNLRRSRRKGGAVDEIGIAETRLESLRGNPQRRSTRQTSRHKLVEPSVNKKTTSRVQQGASSLPIVIENEEPSDNYNGPTMPEVSTDNHIHLSDKDRFTNCDSKEGFGNKSNETISIGVVDVAAMSSDKERNADASVSLQKTCSPSLNLVGASSDQKTSQDHGEPVVLKKAEIDHNVVFDGEQKCVAVVDNMDKGACSLGCVGFGDVELVETDLAGSQTQTQSPLSLNVVGSFPVQGTSAAERKPFVVSMPELCPAVFAADAKKLVADEIVDKSSPSDGGSDSKPGHDLHTRSCSKLEGASSEKEIAIPLVLNELATGPDVIVDQAGQDGNFELDFNDETCPLQTASVCIMDNSIEPQPEEFQMTTESPKSTKVVSSQQALETARASAGLNEESKTNFIDDSEKLVTFGIAESDVESRASFAKDIGLANAELKETVCSLTSPNPSDIYMGRERPRIGGEEIDRDFVVDERERVFTIHTANHDNDQPRVVECMTLDRNVCSLQDGISSNQEDFAGLEAPESSPEFEENVTERIEASCQVDDNLLAPVVEQVSEVKINLLLEENPFDLFNSGMIDAHEPLHEGEINQSCQEEKGTDEDAKKLVGDEIVDKSTPSDGGSDAEPGQDLHHGSCSNLGGDSADKKTSDIASEPLVLSELETGPSVIVSQADLDGNIQIDFADQTSPLKTAPVCIVGNSVVPQPEEFHMSTESPNLTKVVGSQQALEVARASVGLNEESKTNFIDDSEKMVTFGIAENDVESRASFAKDRGLVHVELTGTDVCSLTSPNSSDVYMGGEKRNLGGEEIDRDTFVDDREKVFTVPIVNHDYDQPRVVECMTSDPNVCSLEDGISSNQEDIAGLEKAPESLPYIGENVTERIEGSCQVDDNLLTPIVETVEQVSEVKSNLLLEEPLDEGEIYQSGPEEKGTDQDANKLVGDEIVDRSSPSSDGSDTKPKVYVHEHLDEEEIYQSGLEEKGADEATGACRTGEHDEHRQDSVYKNTYMENSIPLASQDEQSGDTSRPLKLEGNLTKLGFKVSKLDEFSPYALSGGVSPDSEDSIKNLKEPVHNVLELDAKADALDTDEEMNGVEMDDSAVIPSEDLLPIDDLRSMDACNEDEQCDPVVTPQVTPVETIELPTPKSSRKEAMTKSGEGELLVDGKTETASVSELIISLPVENKDSELDTSCGLENVEENAAIVEPASVQVAKEQVEGLNHSYIDELIVEVADELKKEHNVLAEADESQGSVEQQHPSLTAIDEAMCYETEFLRQQSNIHDRVDSIQGCQNYEDESLNVENSHAASFEQSEEHGPSSKLNQEKDIAVVGDQMASRGAETEESNSLVTKQLSSSMIKVFCSDMKENMLEGTEKKKIIELPTPESSRKEAMTKSGEGELLVDGKTEIAGVSQLITSFPVAENKDSELDIFCGLENVEENAAIVEPASVQVAREQVEELSYSCIDELIIEVGDELKKQHNVLAKADESQGSVEQQHPSLAAIDEAICYETEFLWQQSNMHDRVDSTQGCQNYEDESLNVDNAHAGSKLNQEEGANLSPKEAAGSNTAVVGDQMASRGAETEESNSLVTKQMSSSMIKVFYSDMKENMLDRGTKKKTKIGTMMTPKTVPNRRALEDLRKN